MTANRLDDAIIAYSRDRTDGALRSLHETFLSEKLHVPASEPARELQPGRFDIPVICLRTGSGAGAIPVFSTVEHLLKWRPQGCLYTSLTGRAVLEMASGMKEISEILVNPNDVPRGRIPQGDSERMLRLR